MTSQLKNKDFKNILLLLVASVLYACNEHTVYHAFQSIPIEGWQRKDTLLFNVEVPDSQTYYKLSIEVRNRNNYPYQNINLSLSYCDSLCHIQVSDTIHLTLADKEGKWMGDGWGGLYQTAFSAGSVRIGNSGTYYFKIAYTLSDQILQGINDIGIKLER